MPKYNHIDNIPAKVFFRILKTKDLQQLKPKSREKGLDVVFACIYDDFFIKSDNPESKEYLRLHNEIVALEFKIHTLKRTIAFYYNTPTTIKMRMDFIASFKAGFGIEIDPEADFLSEVHRVITQELGIIENDLEFAKNDFNAMIKKSEAKDFDYFDSISAIGMALPNNTLLKENMTLSTYVSLSNLAKRKVSKELEKNTVK